MASKLITLENWAELNYGSASPNMDTLRRWAREARIYPAPQKHGRTYFVAPDACYLKPNRSARGAGGLLERIQHAEKTRR